MSSREVVTMQTSSINVQRGTSLIEVLVTVVILTFGLLGLVGLQSRLQLSEMESYQRAQAMILLEDMANRITSNRAYAATYVTADPVDHAVGTGTACTAPAGTRQQIDTGEWCSALLGAGEKTGTSNVGTLLSGRGCVEKLDATNYMVTVAWQGLGPISAPPASVACGQGKYNGTTGSTCTADLCRRVVTTIVNVASLN